jgi:two-component system, LytTR family, response regulator LytT
MIKVLIIEDEELTADDLELQVRKYADDMEVIAKLSSIAESILYLKKNEQPDLVFSDIQLQDGVSFEIFRAIPLECPVIFCTAYDEFALDAIKNNGIDYILKPFSREEVFTALDKFFQWRKILGSPSVDMNRFLGDVDRLRKVNSVLVYYRDRIIPIRLDDISLFYRQNEITYLKCLDGKSYPIDQTMDYFESVVGIDFFRISRQVIIHRRSIKETVSLFNRKLEIVPFFGIDFKLEVSRNRVSDFLEWLAIS